MASTAVNQNSIVDIVKAKVNEIQEILTLVSSRLKSLPDIKKLKNVKVYISDVAEILAEIGRDIADIERSNKRFMESMTVVVDVVKSISDMMGTIAASKLSSKQIRMMSMVTSSIAQFIKDIVSYSNAVEVENLVHTQKILQEMEKVLNQVDAICKIIGKGSITSAMFMKLLVLRALPKMLNALIKRLAKIEEMPQEVAERIKNLDEAMQSVSKVTQSLIYLSFRSAIAMASMPMMMLYLKALNIFIKHVAKIDASAITEAKVAEIQRLHMVLSMLMSVAQRIALLALIAPVAIGAMPAIWLFTFGLGKILSMIDTVITKYGIVASKKNIETLKDIKDLLSILIQVGAELVLLAMVGILAVFSMPIVIGYMYALTLFLKAIRGALKIISKINPSQAVKVLMEVATMLGSIMVISVAIIVLGAIAGPAMMSMFVVVLYMLALTAFLLVLKVIIWVADKLITTKTIASLMSVVYIILIMTVIAGELWLLAKIADPVTSKFMTLLKFAAFVLVITTAFVGIGWLASVLSGIIGMAITGMGLILALIGVMVLIALALWFLGAIKLDTDKIKENVKVILSTAWYIAISIFDNEEQEKDTKGPRDKKSMGDAIGAMLGGALVGLAACIEMILGVVYLALIFAAVALILLIALALRTLQELELDQGLIITNVQKVFETAHFVTENVFPGNDDGEDPQPKSGLGDVIKHLLGKIIEGIFFVIEMVLAVTFLALTFVAVGLILMIAGMLRILQTIELDGEAIQANVAHVFDVANQIVMMTIFPNYDKEEPAERTNSWSDALVWIINWICAPLIPIIKIIGLLFAIITLALTLIAIALIWMIANCLSSIQDIELNEDAVKNGVSTVINASDWVADAIFNPQSSKKGGKEEKGGLAGFFEWLCEHIPLFKTFAKIIQFIIAIPFLLLTLVCIGIILQISNTLKELEKDQWNPARIEQVKKGVSMMFDAVNGIYTAIFETLATRGADFDFDDVQDEMDHLQDFSERSVKIFDTLKPLIGGDVDGIVANLNKLPSMADSLMVLVKKWAGLREESAQAKEQGLEGVWTSMKGFVQDDDWTKATKNADAMANFVEQFMRCYRPLIVASMPTDMNSLRENIRYINRYITADLMRLATRWSKLKTGTIDNATDRAESMAEFIENFMKSYDSVRGLKGIWSVYENIKHLPTVITDTFVKLINRFSALNEDNVEDAEDRADEFGDFMTQFVDAYDKVKDLRGVWTVYTNVQHLPKITEALLNAVKVITGDAAGTVKTLSLAESIIESLKDTVLGIVAVTKVVSTYSIPKDVDKNVDALVKSFKLFVPMVTLVSETRCDRGHAEDVIDICKSLNEVVYDFTMISSARANGAIAVSNHYIKFLDKVNSMDLEKLRQSVDLFRALADFSESINGNFDSLADTLREEIGPLLKELKEQIEAARMQIEQNGPISTDTGGGFFGAIGSAWNAATDFVGDAASGAVNAVSSGISAAKEMIMPSKEETTPAPATQQNNFGEILTTLNKIYGVMNGNNNGVKIRQ